VGLRPRPDNVVEVNPLIPEGTWDYFCLDNVPYHGRVMTILYDKTGEHYGKGKGLRVFADGRLIAIGESLQRVRGTLPSLVAARAAQPLPGGYRFPAMWGPNFDWIPDQDHGNNILTTVQNMLLQSDGRRLFLLPA